MNRRGFLTNSAATVSLLAGCGGGGRNGTTTNPTTTDAPGETVDIDTHEFRPRELRVEPGRTVTWLNKDDTPHTVTSGELTENATVWEFEESVESGNAVSYTFESNGLYEYYCSEHGKAEECGVVKVGDAVLSGTLPCNKVGGAF